VLVEEAGGTLVTIAKDVKVQVELNPHRVDAYRLIGYENRLLRAEDFNDDRRDAGEIGAGHSVTALYEIVPAGVAQSRPRVDPLKYQQPRDVSDAASSDELMTVKLRYKEPDGDESRLVSVPVVEPAEREPSQEQRFAAAVAGFGMLLRDSPHKGSLSYDMVLELARSGRGSDPEGYRSEFVRLVELAKVLG
jgi:Ca-activated chloride channel family protein